MTLDQKLEQIESDLKAIRDFVTKLEESDSEKAKVISEIKKDLRQIQLTKLLWGK